MNSVLWNLHILLFSVQSEEKPQCTLHSGNSMLWFLVSSYIIVYYILHNLYYTDSILVITLLVLLYI